MFESMVLERRVLILDSPSRGCINKGMLNFLYEEKTVCCTKLLLERRFIARDKTEKPSDEPPTDREHRPGDRAD